MHGAHVSYAVTGLTPGRIGPTVVAVLALVAVVVGWLALTRRAGRTGAVAALVLGPLSTVAGVAFAVTADGGLGTGNGLGGAIVAVALGALATALGALALARSRSAARPPV